jgi:hypothetical protein
MSPRRFRVWLSLAAVLAGVGACEINPQPPLPLGGKGPETPSPNTGGTVMDGTAAGSSSGGAITIGQGGTGVGTAGTTSTAGSGPVEVPGDGGAGGAPGAGGAGGDSGQDGGAGGQDDGTKPPK